MCKKNKKYLTDEKGNQYCIKENEKQYIKKKINANKFTKTKDYVDEFDFDLKS